MKKALIYALALALALSLTACGQPKAEQPTDPAPSTSAPEPIATPEPIKDTAPEPEPEQTPAAPVETEDTQPPEETESQEDEVQLFTEVNETVYATGTVNLRSGPSTNDTKVGSLNKGDRATRIGIGTGDYEGWSLIQTQDWKIAYVSNNYLSTTKPSTNTNNNEIGTQGKPQGSTQQGKPQGGGQPSGDSGTVIDDGSSGVSSGSILSDPSKLTEGIDPNKDPWDTQYKPIYGGN